MGNKLVKMIMAGLKFSANEIGEVAEQEDYTSSAILLLSISVLLDTIIAYFRGNGGNSGLAGMGLTGINASIGEFGSALIGTFVSAWIMVYVIRIFKVSPSFNGILRTYGSAIIWTILGSLLGLFVAGVPAMIVGVVLWLAYNFALLFGLMGYTKIAWWKSFLSIVLTFIGVFVVIMVYGMIIGAIF